MSSRVRGELAGEGRCVARPGVTCSHGIHRSEPSTSVQCALVLISLDATFRAASKATIIDDANTRTKSYKGGIETVLNEKDLIIAWVRHFVFLLAGLRSGRTEWCPTYNVKQRFCQTELLLGLKRRFTLLGITDPEMAVVDNCRHNVKAAIKKAFPDIVVCLNVWHFIMRCVQCFYLPIVHHAKCFPAARYLICLIRGSENLACRGNLLYSNTVAYLGVPYAEPPFGERRFRAPIPLDTARVACESKGKFIKANVNTDFCVQGSTGGRLRSLPSCKA